MRYAYYNEVDSYCCTWLRTLISRHLLPLGYVDSRPIQEIQADDLRGYAQAHLFAGIGGWPLALQLAGWPDGRPIWTGSCPCQPFSVAGKRKGAADERHLWPYFYRLIRACRPMVVMGEQVTGKDGYAWLDGVRSDLEAEGYTCGAVDIPACAVNAPHRRNRIYWVAHRLSPRLERREGESGDDGPEREATERGGSGSNRLEHAAFDRRGEGRAKHGMGGGRNSASSASGAIGRMVHPDNAQRRADEPRGHNDHGAEAGWREGHGDVEGSSRAVGRVGDAIGESVRCSPGEHAKTTGDLSREVSQQRIRIDHGADGARGFWDSWELVGPDPQGKYRRVKPGIRLLADGVLCRVAKLRALGNAIVPPLAAEVIRAWMETMDG